MTRKFLGYVESLWGFASQFAAILMISGLLTASVFGQPNRESDSSGELISATEVPGAAETEDKKDSAEEEEEEEKTIEEIVEGFEKMEGLFTLYRDPKTGGLMMEILPGQLDQEYIYFSFVVNGVVAAHQFRGSYNEQAIFRLRRYFDRIEFVEQNTRFYFDPENPLARASDANISEALLASTRIVALSEDEDRFLINLDEVLLNESLSKLKPTPDPEKKPHEQFSLGSLSEDKTRYANIRVYPRNINVSVDYVYNNDAPYIRGGSEVTDPRAVTLRMQHTFLEVPDNNYEPRLDDARIGYFFDETTDLTSHRITPYRDLINRWDLQKKHPEQEISEPVNPIVWWMENTTPYEYRDAIREGVLAWNQAFEKAGFRNAIVVKMQPDDAEWDAGDIRYNVLRWTSSPNPPFGGYGPSFSNPRTGQILSADIMLEDVYARNRVRSADIFESTGIQAHDDWIKAGKSGDSNSKGRNTCRLSESIGQDMMFARSVMASMGDSAEMGAVVQESLKELALHEVGHTLGLNHNMRSSQLRSNDQIHDASVTRGVLIGSVMDYGSINFAPPGREQGNYYTTRPGPYDIWAIQFGYDPDLTGEARQAHLARSKEPQLAFGNDADDMRSAGKAIDPRVNVNDMSSDAILYAQDRFALVDEVLSKILEKLSRPGETWANMRNAYTVLTNEQLRQARIVSRYIGGVYVDRSVLEENGDASRPYQPVPENRQRQAMQVLSRHIFSEDAFRVSGDLISHLAMQRRGFAHMSVTEDPKIHARALKIQKDVLDQLLHPVVLRRVTDTTLYGNSYDLAEVLSDLTSAIFETDLKGGMTSFRQNLQVEYTQRLLKIIARDSDHDFLARSVALTEIEKIESWMKKYGRGKVDSLSQSTRRYVLFLIEQGLDREG